jgi:hypothetical protein
MCHLGYMGKLHNYYRLLMGWGVTSLHLLVIHGDAVD